jgi:hypothetical protein
MPDAPVPRRWFVDRREGEWWVVAGETGQVIELPDWILPRDTLEGDALEIVVDDDGDDRVIRIRRDPARTEQLRSEVAAVHRRLRTGQPDGDPNR